MERKNSTMNYQGKNKENVSHPSIPDVNESLASSETNNDQNLKGILIKTVGEDQSECDPDAAGASINPDHKKNLENKKGVEFEGSVSEKEKYNMIPSDVDNMQKEDDSKAVTFAEDVEVFDLGKKDPPSVSVALSAPNSSDKVDSPESVGQQSTSPVGQNESVIKIPNGKADHIISDEPVQASVELSGLEIDTVVAVDEQHEDGGEKGEESQSLLRKTSKTPSDDLSQSGYIDTIGPLENADFLRRVQSSVSYPYGEDDQSQGDSNLDLVEFTPSDSNLPDIDRGYAWIILTSAIVALALLGATTIAAGVLMPAILDQIDPDITKASWIGSVHVSTMCMSGPFVGIVLNRLGSRWTVLIAGIIIFGGFIGASFAQSILHLIFTHGFISGLGSGFVLNTMFVSVGQRFNRFRGLACGLLATGTGVGLLAGGSVLSALLSSFGLRGTYLLWAGILLHITPCGLFMRPSGEQKFRNLEDKTVKSMKLHKLKNDQTSASGHQSMISGINSIFSTADQQSVFSRHSSMRRKPGLHRYPSRSSRQDISNPILKAVLHREASRSSHSVAATSIKSTKRSNGPNSPRVTGRFTFGPATSERQSMFSLTPSETPDPSSPVTSDCSDNDLSPTETVSPNSSFLQSNSQNIPDEKGSLTSLDNEPHSPTSTKGASDIGSSFRRRLASISSRTQSQYTSYSHASQQPSLRDFLPKEYDNESLASTLVSALQPVDALAPRYRLGHRSISTIMGSILSFPTSLAIVKDDLARLGDFTIEEEKTMKDHLIGLLDSLRLLKNKPFLVFIITCFMWAFGESPIAIYFPSYAVSQGTSVMQASSLYTAMGLGSMIGRFLSGLIASDSDIGPILLHIGCLSIAGSLMVLSPLITATFSQQLMVAGVFGLYTGSLVPLSSLITIQLLGIEELGLGFGFLSLFQGFGYLIGPPLAGIIVMAIGYEKSFVFSGCTLICASLVAMLTAVFLGKVIEQDGDTDSFLDLEKALRKVSERDSDDEDEVKTSRLSLSKPVAGSFKRNDGRTPSWHPVGQDSVVLDSRGAGDESKDVTDSGLTGDDVLEPIAEEAERQSMLGLDG